FCSRAVSPLPRRALCGGAGKPAARSRGLGPWPIQPTADSPPPASLESPLPLPPGRRARTNGRGRRPRPD
ncbi:MAG: hypothetical protein EOR27_30685, partial [Mesorhizobium sp.]